MPETPPAKQDLHVFPLKTLAFAAEFRLAGQCVAEHALR